MKSTIKKLLKTLPVANKVYGKYTALKAQNAALDAESRAYAAESIRLRLALKHATGEPIHVVFVCHRPAV